MNKGSELVGKELSEKNNSDQKTVGIPKGLIYYHYPVLFETFFESLGAKIVYSPESSKKLLLDALKYASDEECFSGKVFIGHVNALRGKVDYLFLPKFHGTHKTDVNCPKFIGLPDVLRAIFDDLPELIGYYHSRTKRNHRLFHLWRIIFKTGWKITKNPFKIIKAANKAIKAHRQYQKTLRWTTKELHQWENQRFQFCPICDESFSIEQQICPACHSEMLTDSSTEVIENVRIALLGHAYVLNDPILSFSAHERLEKLGVEVITSEQIPEEIINQELEKLHSRLYFKEERRIVGTALYFLRTEKVDGILQIIPFPCGPTAVSSEIIMRFAKKKETMGVPLLQLMVDDNTGEAGFDTRLEAFVTMLKRKKFFTSSRGSLIRAQKSLIVDSTTIKNPQSTNQSQSVQEGASSR
ncbi:MAG: hypothetical protein GF308_07580 [Candidatus Heimdallarchaeota archaeon]|nr:hypothetical protein [Candidatus Heimdallarchaeota archaeon]